MGLWRKIRSFRQTTNLKAIPGKTPSEDVMKLVFPYLGHLGRCMLVCKLWRDILSKDEYIAKCLFMPNDPAFCKPGTGVTSFRRLYQTIFRERCKLKLENISPRLSANDLEFYLDIWSDDQRLILSRAVPMQALKGKGRWSPPSGIRISDPGIMPHLERGYEFKLILLLEPRLIIRRPRSITVSLLAGERGSDKVARLIKKSESVVDPGTSVAVASGDDLCFSPEYPFVAASRAWVGLFFDQEIKRDEGVVHVFRIELGFYHVPYDISADPDRSRRLFNMPRNRFVSTEENVLKLLGMLEWK